MDLLAAVLASACFCVQEQKAVLVVKGVVCDAPPWLSLDSWRSLKEEFPKTIVSHFQSQGFSEGTRSLIEALGI